MPFSRRQFLGAMFPSMHTESTVHFITLPYFERPKTKIYYFSLSLVLRARVHWSYFWIFIIITSGTDWDILNFEIVYVLKRALSKLLTRINCRLLQATVTKVKMRKRCWLTAYRVSDNCKPALKSIYPLKCSKGKLDKPCDRWNYLSLW